MSFRKLSLLFISVLLTTLLFLQWLSINQFTKDVAKQIGESAFEVSRSTAETLIFDQPKIQVKSFSINSNTQIFDQAVLDKVVNSFSQDVTLQLIDEQKDDVILLDADGANFQIPIPRTGIHRALDNFSKNVFYSTIILLILGVILAYYFTNKMTGPLRKLQKANQKVGAGKLGVQIDIDKKWNTQEIDSTLKSFNQMSLQIEALQKQNEALQAKAHLAEVAEVSRGLAHSIRNPLNTLNLAIDQFETEMSKSKFEELRKISKKQIKRIDSWVHSLMNVISDDETLIKSCNIHSLINETLQDIELANEKQIEIKFRSNNKSEKISIIEPELKGILLNLIANSVESSLEQSTISISLQIKDGLAQVEIIDQGNGFSEKIINNLFSPHNTDKTYGAGMGLYLAYRVIKHKYGGNITISNNTPTGATVTLTFGQRVI